MWTHPRRRPGVRFSGRGATEKEDQLKEASLSIDAEQTNHVSVEQQEQLMTLPNKYQDSFKRKCMTMYAGGTRDRTEI